MLTHALHALVAVVLGQQPAPQPTFADVATKYFSTWDVNHDGTLSASEVDALCVDPVIKGPEAAAAAAIKRIIRSDKFEVSPLTLTYLTAPAPKAARPAEPADRADSPEQPTRTTERRPANFQSSFAASLRRINTAKRDLFLDETPDLDKCHQGPLGDCYFVATIGAMVHREPQDIKHMITPRPQGGYEVAFQDGRHITLTALTDAEVALSGTTGDEGLWLPVLEKALGELRRQSDPKKYTAETATDAIANGGSTGSIIKLITGHQTTRIPLKKRAKPDQSGPDGKPIELPPVPADEPDTLAANVRKGVSAALAQNRLVTCGTGTEKQPPGISGKHAYAIFALDQDADTITVWNPHGNTFKPKGEPSLAHGYPTKAGLFTLPVKDFVLIFNGVTIESDKALDATPPQPAAKSPKPASTKG